MAKQVKNVMREMLGQHQGEDCCLDHGSGSLRRLPSIALWVASVTRPLSMKDKSNLEPNIHKKKRIRKHI